MPFLHAAPLTKKHKHRAIAALLDNSAPDSDFFVLLAGSVVLAIGAIFTDSVAVLIASMVVAPLAHPILALGLGVAAQNWKLAGRSLGLLAASCLAALAIAAAATWAFGGERATDKYISFDGNRDVAAVVALAAGAIGAYGLMRPKIASAITGVAIAVSLMPPLVATGINYAAGDTAAGRDALILFLLNVACIFIASAGVFWGAGVGREYGRRAGNSEAGRV